MRIKTQLAAVAFVVASATTSALAADKKPNILEAYVGNHPAALETLHPGGGGSK